MIAPRQAKLIVSNELLQRCYEDMTPHLERTLKRTLSRKEDHILRKGIEAAAQNTRMVYSYLAPARTQSELRLEIQSIQQAIEDASSRIGELVNDDWFMEALKNAFESATKATPQPPLCNGNDLPPSLCTIELEKKEKERAFNSEVHNLRAS